MKAQEPDEITRPSKNWFAVSRKNRYHDEMRRVWITGFLAASACAPAQVADFLQATQFAWGVGDNLPAPYTQVDMNVSIEVRVGIFWVPYAQNVGVNETLLTKASGSPNFSVPINSISTVFTSSEPLNWSGVVSGNQVTWTANQTFSQTGGYVINTQFDNNGTPVPVNVVVNNVLTVGTLRALFANITPILVPTLSGSAGVRGTYTGGDPVNYIDMTAGSASGTVNGIAINGMRLKFRNIQHINHPPLDLKVTGSIVRNDVVAPSAFVAQFELLPAGGGAPVASADVAVAANGDYIWRPQNVLPGNYRLRVRSGSHLARAQAVALGTASTANFVLPNGDADQSGEVDAIDIDVVIANFGGTTNGPTVFPDIDLSGEVDAIDIDLTIANFGQVAD